MVTLHGSAFTESDSAEDCEQVHAYKMQPEPVDAM